MTISKLDLYLLAGMRVSPRVLEKLNSAGLSPGAVRSLTEQARAAGFSNAQTLSRTKVERFFGPPFAETDTELTYKLSEWPEHFYDWAVARSGIVSHKGFRLRSDRSLPSWVPRTLTAATDVFEVFSDTEHEVIEGMGEPNLRLGWGTSWSLYYGPDEDEHDLVFDFDFGLLQDIRDEQSAVLKYGSGENTDDRLS